GVVERLLLGEPRSQSRARGDHADVVRRRPRCGGKSDQLLRCLSTEAERRTTTEDKRAATTTPQRPDHDDTTRAPPRVGIEDPPATRGERTAQTLSTLCRFRADFRFIPDTITSADGISRCPPGARTVNQSRRLSQAISEGDGISLLVPVDGIDDARSAEHSGAEGIVVTRYLDGLRDATTLPVLYLGDDAAGAGADACLLWVERTRNGTGLRDLNAKAKQLGLEPVIGVRDDEELELALEEIDPEIVLLAPEDDGEDPLEQVLDLLPDVPAGKLAIAEVQIRS